MSFSNWKFLETIVCLYLGWEVEDIIFVNDITIFKKLKSISSVSENEHAPTQQLPCRMPCLRNANLASALVIFKSYLQETILRELT